jgi:2-amino-4-hydroxy-6-hydroxymethyldihydropteridine diphosphokinase
MNAAFLCLGGNLGDRRENLRRALHEIERHCGSIKKRSSVYETEPWGSSTKTPFYNMVVKLKTALSARELIERVLLIEEKLGRKRNGDQNSDRLIDIDVLFYNRIELTTKGLQVPHPRLHLRRFVLVPLNEIASDFIHPTLDKNIGKLLRECKDKLKVKRLKDLPECNYICIEGNIGSGKTTLAKALAKKLKALYIAENFEENNLLPLFYSKPRIFAFPLEYSFLIGRFDQLKREFRENHGQMVSDFSFYKSLWFAKANLRKKEFELFEKHFKALEDEMRPPDLLIYLNAGKNNLLKNIAARGRSYEHDINEKYLNKLEKSYLNGLKTLSCKVLRLDIKDYSREPEKQLLKQIENYIEENFG